MTLPIQDDNVSTGSGFLLRPRSRPLTPTTSTCYISDRGWRAEESKAKNAQFTCYLLNAQFTICSNTNQRNQVPVDLKCSTPNVRKKVNMNKWRILKISIMLSRENDGSQWSAIEFNTKLKSYSFSLYTYSAPNHLIECHPKFGDDRLAPKLFRRMLRPCIQVV